MKGPFKFLDRWYENTKALARHEKAMPALAVVSFAESSFFWVFGAGLTPFPYKVITIMSGAVPISFGIFVAASVIARTMRFFAVAGLVRLLGAQAEAFMKKHFGLFTVLVFIFLAACWFGYKPYLFALTLVFLSVLIKSVLYDVQSPIRCQSMLQHLP